MPQPRVLTSPRPRFFGALMLLEECPEAEGSMARPLLFRLLRPLELRRRLGSEILGTCHYCDGSSSNCSSTTSSCDAALLCLLLLVRLLLQCFFFYYYYYYYYHHHHNDCCCYYYHHHYHYYLLQLLVACSLLRAT